MRRLSLALLVALLALPATAVPARAPVDDGTLEVVRANGRVSIQGKGVIWGQFDKGTLTVVSYVPAGLAVPTVTGAKMDLTNKATVIFTNANAGANVRFMFPRGEYYLRFDATDVRLSAVGSGSVQALGRGSVVVDDGKPLAFAPKLPLPPIVTFGVVKPAVTGAAAASAVTLPKTQSP
jgi:hypothetical protein